MILIGASDFSREHTEKFMDAKYEWDRSTDCAELKSKIELLLDFGLMPPIRKIVCFGLGHLFDPYMDDHPANAEICCHNFRRRAQHAAALTIAELLDESQGGPKVKLIAQDPLYSKYDKACLGELGFEVADWRHGHQEGFVAVDDATFVLTFNFGDRVQQVGCETARPAAMMWCRPDEVPHDACRLGDPGIGRTLEFLDAEYWASRPSCLRHAWERGHEAEVVDKGELRQRRRPHATPGFGVWDVRYSVPVNELRRDGRDWDRAATRGVVSTVRRRHRPLAPTTLYVRKWAFLISDSATAAARDNNIRT